MCNSRTSYKLLKQLIHCLLNVTFPWWVFSYLFMIKMQKVLLFLFLLLLLCSYIFGHWYCNTDSKIKMNTNATPAAALRITSVGRMAAHVCLCLSLALREWTVERQPAFQPIKPRSEMSSMAMTTAPKRSPQARSLRQPSGRKWCNGLFILLE